MKTNFLLLIITTIALSGCAIFHKSESGNVSLKKLKEEPWYFCNTDSLWTYDDNGNSLLCSDYNQVRRLRVTNILGEIYFKGGENYCEETDSVIIGETLLVTASDLKNMAVPIDSLINLQVLDLSDHHFFKFPYEVFQIPKLTAINISSLCLHDYCEPCIYTDERFLKSNPDRGKPMYVDSADFDNYYKTDLKPYYEKLRQLKFIMEDRYLHPDDCALIDSINTVNDLEKHWSVFECTHRMCNYNNYEESSEDEMLKVDIIWE